MAGKRIPSAIAIAPDAARVALAVRPDRLELRTLLGETYTLAAGADERSDVVPSAGAELDYTIGRAEADGRLRDVVPPETIDLRAPWYGVADQGATGSSIGWALADSVLRWQLVTAGRLEPAQRLSARFLWTAAKELRFASGLDPWPSSMLAAGQTDAKSALEVARRFGVPLESELAWQGGTSYASEDEFYAAAARHRIAAYYRLDSLDDDEWLDACRRWIHQQGPVLLVHQVDGAFAAGLPVLERVQLTGRGRLHASALVGYTPQGFIVRCSWGSGWGDGGYAAATHDYLSQIRRESFGTVI